MYFLMQEFRSIETFFHLSCSKAFVKKAIPMMMCKNFSCCRCCRITSNRNSKTNIVFATDVRMSSKEQVESLGGKFLTVEGAENLETSGGYAKETSDEFKKKQEDLLSETLKKIDMPPNLF